MHSGQRLRWLGTFFDKYSETHTLNKVASKSKVYVALSNNASSSVEAPETVAMKIINANNVYRLNQIMSTLFNSDQLKKLNSDMDDVKAELKDVLYLEDAQPFPAEYFPLNLLLERNPELYRFIQLNAIKQQRFDCVVGKHCDSFNNMLVYNKDVFVYDLVKFQNKSDFLETSSMLKDSQDVKCILVYVGNESNFVLSTDPLLISFISKKHLSKQRSTKIKTISRWNLFLDLLLAINPFDLNKEILKNIMSDPQFKHFANVWNLCLAELNKLDGLSFQDKKLCLIYVWTMLTKEYSQDRELKQQNELTYQTDVNKDKIVDCSLLMKHNSCQTDIKFVIHAGLKSEDKIDFENDDLNSLNFKKRISLIHHVQCHNVLLPCEVVCMVRHPTRLDTMLVSFDSSDSNQIRSFVHVFVLGANLTARVLLETPEDVTSMAFCPFDESVLSIGCANGRVALFNLPSQFFSKVLVKQRMNDLLNLKEKLVGLVNSSQFGGFSEDLMDAYPFAAGLIDKTKCEFDDFCENFTNECCSLLEFHQQELTAVQKKNVAQNKIKIGESKNQLEMLITRLEELINEYKNNHKFHTSDFISQDDIEPKNARNVLWPDCISQATQGAIQRIVWMEMNEQKKAKSDNDDVPKTNIGRFLTLSSDRKVHLWTVSEWAIAASELIHDYETNIRYWECETFPQKRFMCLDKHWKPDAEIRNEMIVENKSVRVIDILCGPQASDSVSMSLLNISSKSNNQLVDTVLTFCEKGIVALVSLNGIGVEDHGQFTFGKSIWYDRLKEEPKTTYCSFSPFIDNLILFGHSDAIIVYYSNHVFRQYYYKLTETTIKGVEWSRTRVSDFFTIHADGYLSKWDFMDQSHGPISRIKLGDKCCSMVQVVFHEKNVIAVGGANEYISFVKDEADNSVQENIKDIKNMMDNRKSYAGYSIDEKTKNAIYRIRDASEYLEQTLEIVSEIGDNDDQQVERTIQLSKDLENHFGTKEEFEKILNDYIRLTK